MRRPGLIAIIALLVGCGGPVVPASSNGSGTTTPPSSVATLPTLTPRPGGIATFEPTRQPDPTAETTSPPEGVAEVEVTATFFRPWVNVIDDVQFQLIVEVENVGSAAADISAGSNDYTIYDKDGGVLETGSFTYSFPQILQPGDVGYYIETGYFDDGVRLREVGEADPSVYYEEISEEQRLFDVSKVRVSKEPFGDGLQVSGVIRNTSGSNAEDVVVGVIFFDEQDKIIGGLFENTVGALRSGDQKGFKTSYPGTPPLRSGDVAGFKALAYDYQYFF